MTAPRTARERARAELTQQIKDEARRQVASQGADRLSLRAVSRELGMVSSALYRYFPSRDELLTALIIDAYDAIGAATESAEQASSGSESVRDRWHTVCRAVRQWAVAYPHEYALIYGSPVPGYRAPQETVAPASRVPLVLVGIVGDAWHNGRLEPAFDGPALSTTLHSQIARLSEDIAPELPEPVLARVLIAWTQLFGMLSFELFGQLVGSVDPSDEFFEYAAEQMARFVGLSAADGSE